MESETIIFIGGPLDGMAQERPVGLSLIQVPVRVGGEDHDTLLRYGQADVLDPTAESFTAQGERRYVYLGPWRGAAVTCCSVFVPRR